MSNLQERYKSFGAELAPDGIPLHFGDLQGEYNAAIDACVLFDRSHEGRIRISGPDRLDLINRISTNDVANLGQGEGRPTIFTNTNARVIDRVTLYHWEPETVLVLTGPGRNASVGNYLQKNIFFQDKVSLENLAGSHHQFSLHGPTSDAVLAHFLPDVAATEPMTGRQTEISGQPVFVARDIPFTSAHWRVICRKDGALAVWDALLEVGQTYGIEASGGLTYNTLRIRAGRPAIGFELTDAYIPLELGLWDEVSFSKGCYTGQEIIARMESRGQLAKALVRLELPAFVRAPQDLITGEGKRAGRLTSSVQAPTGEIFAIGVVKTEHARARQKLSIQPETELQVTVIERLGVQPEHLFDDGV